jgi:hypothetical protein
MPIIAQVTATVSGGTTAVSRAVPLNMYNEPFDVSFGLTVEGSAGDDTVSVAVQHTFDNIYDSAVSAVWFNHSEVTAAIVGTVDGSYTEPIAAIRANVGTGTAAGVQTKAILKILQTGY